MNKGMSTISSLAVIILILMSFFVILFFVISTSDVYKNSARDNTCKNSVSQYASFGLSNINRDTLEINCPTRKLVLSGDENLLKKQIADEMYRCWIILEEGNSIYLVQG